MNFFATLLVFFGISISTIIYSLPEVSLHDKIGQMLLLGFDGKKVNSRSEIVKQIEKNNIGGVILFDYDPRSKTFDKNIESRAQVKKLSAELQYYTHEANINHHRPLLPLFISIDYEGGLISRLSEQYGFPKTKSAFEVGKGSTAEAEKMASAMATTLKEVGINLNFAPVLDVNVNPNNPIIGKKERSFSSDPSRVTHFAGIYTRELLNQGIQCVYKHFPGHGSSTKDSHLGFVDVTKSWQPDELNPYNQLLSSNKACGAIMTAHIVNKQLDESGLPATLSHTILSELLRKQMHFNGLIITDDLQMKAISDNYSLEKALVLTINAGADVLIWGNNYLSLSPVDPAEIIKIVEAKVQSGEISEERINEAYQRIVHFKLQE